MNFRTDTPEHLFIWLMQFNANGQLNIIRILNIGKSAKFWKAIGKSIQSKHNYCDCEKFLRTSTDQTFRDRIICENVGKCIEDDDSSVRPIPEKLLQGTKISLNANDKRKILTLKFTKCTKITNNFLTLKCDVANKKVESLKLLDLNINYHSTEKLRRILLSNLQYIDIRQLYGLFVFCIRVTRDIFELLLPEYWRSSERTRRLTKNRSLTLITVLSYVYAFHAARDVTFYSNISDSSCHYTFKLQDPITFEESPTVVTSSYILQPLFTGYRVIVCKNDNSTLYVTNRHGIKIHIPGLVCSIFKNSLSFTAEFMVHSKDSNEIVHSSKFNNVNLILIPLDIFVYQSINIRMFKYEDRLKVLQKFLKSLDENSMVLDHLIHIESINDAILEYKTLLNTRKPYFEGVIFRDRFIDRIYRYNFNLVRLDFIGPGIGFYRFYEIDRTYKCPVRDVSLAVEFNYSRYKFNILLALDSVEKGSYILCAFDRNLFRPFQRLINVKINNLPKKCKYLYIDGRLREWIVVNLRCNIIDSSNRILDEITYIEFRPEKSLLDCVTLKTLFNF